MSILPARPKSVYCKTSETIHGIPGFQNEMLNRTYQPKHIQFNCDPHAFAQKDRFGQFLYFVKI